MTAFDDCLSKLNQGLTLTETEMSGAMESIMEGHIAESDLAVFLSRLADRGETADEIAGAAKIMRTKATSITAPANAVDCCGTGGDGLGTYNISTAVAFIAAGAGVPVAKHGNRAASSRSGTADVLETLGVNLALPVEVVESALRDIGFCFLMAPRHHQAMKHVASVRRSLGRRTIFNLLGPLSNPAGTKKQLIGVWDRQWVLPLAQALQKLGADSAWVVHGHGGLDEISLAGESHAAILKDGEITHRTLTPADFGLPSSTLADIAGGDAMTNAAALVALLDGHQTAYRNVAVANAAALLMLAGKAHTLKEGVALAEDSIDTGRALRILNQYKDLGK